MRIRFCLLFALASIFLPGFSLAESFDLVVRHGRIIDGIGSPAVYRDIGIRNGKIVSIGHLANANATEVIDAKDLLVAPGFIDVHTHAENIESLPQAENFLRMGVTTLILGNCGSSEIDLASFFTKLETKGISVNLASLIGHNDVRQEAMKGNFDRPPTVEEMEKMKGLVKKAMEDGAIGLSTGLIYLPGTFSKTDEIVELAKVAAHYQGIYASHMRDEALGIFDALNELFQVAREARMPAHVSHIKLSGKSAWGLTGKVLAAIEHARKEGLDITQDQYMYTASSTGISQLVPEWAREGGKLKERLQEEETRAAIISEMKEKLKRRNQDDYSYAVIASYSSNRELNGLNMVEAARKLRGDNSLDAQIETIFEIVSSGGASGVFHGMSEEDLKQFLAHPNTMIAADSAVRRFDEGVPHPRGYGNNARVLSRYVRELGTLRTEEAIRRMTSLPATTFQLKGRGLLAEGYAADLVIYDPTQIQDKATFTRPHQYPAGIHHVIVNGKVAVTNNRITEAKSGQIIRNQGKKLDSEGPE
ncbi:MAG: N-acyl-D-amino-acid deacylase family protein [Verrucomicrobiales bacterium]